MRERLVATNLKLVVTIVEDDSGEDVVAYAKEAGAKGSTILSGRGSGVHDTGRFLGLEIQPEKDVVLTVIPAHLETAVMDSIGQGIKIGDPGNGICFSIDVDKLIGVTHIQDYEVTPMRDLMDEEN